MDSVTLTNIRFIRAVKILHIIFPDLCGSLQYIEPIDPQGISICATSGDFPSATMLDSNKSNSA